MLLTLLARSLSAFAPPAKSGKPPITLLDLPTLAKDELGLRGLNLSASLLAKLTGEQIEGMRDKADRVGCSCLLLLEETPQRFGDPSEDVGKTAVDRTRRVIRAAQLLGCNAAAVACAGPDDDEAMARTIERLKRSLASADRMDLNLLIWPQDGLTAKPDRVTEIIKRVGGFRMGTLPDFKVAAASSDPTTYLRRLTPYAGVVLAATSNFSEKGGELKHGPYALEPLIQAVVSVGYDGTLAIDYRGPGDARQGIARSRQMLDSILMPAGAGDDEDEDALNEAEEAEEQAGEP